MVAFGPLSMDLYLPGLPELARDLDASASAAQLTITACMLGLGAGQLVVGPVSDAIGRRRPLLAGLALYVLASVLCAVAPSIWMLLGLRFVQGLAGSAGIVIARAMVRDLAVGTEAARLYAHLMLVTGLAPMLGPLVGGQLLHITDWRGSFIALALLGLTMLVLVSTRVPETLVARHRHVGGAATSRRAIGDLLRDRRFMAFAVCVGLSFATLTAYLGGAAFLLEDIHGLSPQTFGAIVAFNAAGMVAASQVSARLVRRYGPARLLGVGLGIGALAGLVFLGAIIGHAGLAVLLVCLFFVLVSRGLITPNAQALAMAEHPRAAGTAAGIIGLMQFGIGGAAAPLAGVAGAGSALPMAITIAATGSAAIAVLALRGRRPVAAASA